MKQATGELNATVVVVMAVGVLIAFFYFTLWPIIKHNYDQNAKCSSAICEKCESNNCETVTCHAKGSDQTFECVYKG